MRIRPQNQTSEPINTIKKLNGLIKTIDTHIKLLKSLVKIFWFIQKLALLGCIYKSKALETALVYTTVLSYIISLWKYGINRDFSLASYSRLMPKYTLSPT